MIRAAVAKVWGTAISKEVEAPMPDCSKCRRPGYEEARVAWGCDRPAADPVFRTLCSWCHGSGCDECEDSGYRSHHRCPSAIVSEDPELAFSVRGLLEAYRMQDEHGAFPVAGGLLDQSASYVAGCSIIDEERSRWEKVRQDHHRQHMERTRKAQTPKPPARGRR